MQKQTFAFLAGALLLLIAGVVVVPTMLADDETPLVRWSAGQEVEVPEEPAEAAAGEGADAGAVQRTAVELAEAGEVINDEPRVDVLLRGRVLNKFQAPVADAKVFLDFGRGGQRGGPAARQRRVPDPVQTDREGRFAFQGQTFRNLRVALQVAHPAYAAGLFDKDLGQVKAEVDLGDLVLNNGGEVQGRVTDLEGNSIAGAELRLQPENNNRMRMVRDRDTLLPPATTDNNGFFRLPHLPAGDWSLTATAKRHTEGRSPTFVTEEDQLVELEDIRLGPGYEVTGYVRTVGGQPIAKAEVTLRGQNRGRGARGEDPRNGGGPLAGFGGFGSRDHSTTTDEQGRFFLEHLPSGPMRVEARAEGYLELTQEGLDPTTGQPLQLTLQDGLRIAGRVVDGADDSAVSLFAARAVRLRGLPVAGQANVDLNELMTRMRDGNLDEATRTQLRGQMESLRSQMGDMRRGGPGQGGGPGGRGNQDNGPGGRGGPGRSDLGKPERHADGTFVLTGLQEGIYEVHVQSPEHARFRSQEVELRLGVTPPTLAISLDRGLFVAGVVLGDKGAPVAGARVELRTATANEGGGRRRGRPGAAEAGASTQDLEAIGRDFVRQFSGAQVTLEATTDAEGVFVVKHAPRGNYRLQAQAKGFATATSEPFDLQADRSGFELALGMLGSVAGKVRGLDSKEVGEARVAAVPIGGQNGGFGGMMGRGRGGNGGGNPMNGVGVQPDGSYRIDDLTPGEYLIRSWIGSPQELMRELGPQFFSGTLTADVTVRAGETTTWDVAVTRPQVGIVNGTVLHNGSPATGFQVELARIDEAGAAADRGGQAGQGGPGGRNGMGGRGGWGGGRSFQATVAASGRFAIQDVPAGDYRLRVQAGRRGGMLHEETVQVVANSTTERNLTVTTASLEGSVTTNDTGNPAEFNGSVSLLPGLTAMPENFGAWRREPGNTTFDARVQGGKFRFETLKPGNYLLVLSIRGRERTSAPIVVTPGNGQHTMMAAGKVTEPAANGAAAPNQPANRAGGNARR